MTIEITNPDVEAWIRERMKAGAFTNPEDLIREILRPSETDTPSGAALIDAMRACPFPEIDIEPPRVLTPLVRDVVL